MNNVITGGVFSQGGGNGIAEWNPITDPNRVQSGVAGGTYVIVDNATTVIIDNIPAGTSTGTIIYFNSTQQKWNIASKSDNQEKFVGVFDNPIILQNEYPAAMQKSGSFAKVINPNNKIWIIDESVNPRIWKNSGSDEAPNALKTYNNLSELDDKDASRENINAEKKDATILKQANVVNNLTSTSTTQPLSANQGKELDQKKVDKIAGKDLSANDFNGAYKAQLDNAPANINTSIDNLQNQINSRPVSASDGNTLSFTSQNGTGIAGYHFISYSPDTNAESLQTITITSTTPKASRLIRSYIADQTIGKSIIDSGRWGVNLYGYGSHVDVSSFEIEVFKRDTSGTETSLFLIETSHLTQTAKVSISLNQAIAETTQQTSFACNETDKIVIKVYGKTTRTSNTDITFIQGGSEYASHIHSPLTLSHNQIAGLQGGSSNERYHLTQSEYSQVQNLATALSEKQDATAQSLTTTAKTVVGAINELNNGKVAKDGNKVLTDNNYSTDEKNKLAGIEIGAEKNVQADLSQTDNTKDDFVKNKSNQYIAESTDKRYVSDSEKTKVGNLPVNTNNEISIINASLLTKEINSNKGQANGYAGLSSDSKVVANQLRPIGITFNSTNGIWTFNQPDGTTTTIDTNYENIFQSVNYNSTTKELTFTLVGGATTTIPLNDLVDIAEIYLGTQAPTGAPTTGQKMYINTATSEIYLNVSNTWTSAGFYLSQAEKTKLLNTSGTNTGDQNASTVPNAPAGNISATTVQGAINELDSEKEPANSNIQAHISSISNPHAVTKAQVGLANVDNTSDASKPISTATQTALDLKQNITDITLNTTAKTVVGAVNELKTRIDNSANKNVKQWYLSGGTNGTGSDTNDGYTQNSAFSTLSYALSKLGNTGEQLIHLPTPLTDSAEFTQYNIEVTGAHASHRAICGTSGTYTSKQNDTGSQTFQHLSIGSFVKAPPTTGNAGYTILRDVNITTSYADSTSAVVDNYNITFNDITPISITGGGVKNFYNQRGGIFTINNSSAAVNVVTSDKISQFTLTAGTLSLRNAIVYVAQGTTFTIGASGSTFFAENVRFLYANDSTQAKINIPSGVNYSISNCIYDSANSTFNGTDISGLYQGNYGSIAVKTLNIPSATPLRIAGIDANKNLIGFDTATYPNFIELGYVKGVTSSIQTQLNGKEATITNLPVSKGGVGINNLSNGSYKTLRINSSSNGYNQEFAIPSLTTAEINSLASVPTGYIVYNLTLDKFVQYNGTSWIPIIAAGTGNMSATSQTGATGLLLASNNDTGTSYSVISTLTQKRTVARQLQTILNISTSDRDSLTGWNSGEIIYNATKQMFEKYNSSISLFQPYNSLDTTDYIQSYRNSNGTLSSFLGFDGIVGNVLIETGGQEGIANSIGLTGSLNSQKGIVYKTIGEFVNHKQWTLEADIYNGNNGGADGIWFSFFANAIPTSSNLVSTPNNSYTIYLDEYNNKVQLYYNGALIFSQTFRKLSNSVIKKVVIDIIPTLSASNTSSSALIKVSLPGTSLGVGIAMDRLDNVSRNLSGNILLIGGGTSALNNVHTLNGVKLTKNYQFNY